MSYTVSFDRIGREHDVAPLAVTGTAEQIADQIRRYAKAFLTSRFYDIHVNLEAGTGWIGPRFGEFTLTEDET